MCVRTKPLRAAALKRRGQNREWRPRADTYQQSLKHAEADLGIRRVGESRLDQAEGAIELGAERAEHTDDDDREESGDHAVFHSGNARLLAGERTNEAEHKTAPLPTMREVFPLRLDGNEAETMPRPEPAGRSKFGRADQGRAAGLALNRSANFLSCWRR